MIRGTYSLEYERKEKCPEVDNGIRTFLFLLNINNLSATGPNALGRP